MKGDLTDKVRELISTMPNLIHIDILEKRAHRIIAIGENAKKTALYRKTEKQRAVFSAPLKNVPRDKAILMTWVHVLDRIAKAPSVAHRTGAIIMFFPLLADLLRGRRA